MDLITTAIVAALSVRAAADITDTAKAAINDSYNKLKDLLTKKYGASSEVVQAVERLEEKPTSPGRKELLEEEISSINLYQDKDIIEATYELISVEPQKAGLEKFTVLSTGNTQGQAIGDSEQIVQHFYNIINKQISPTFRIRIVEEPLTSYNLTSILSAITDLSTKCWLIAKRRLTDLIEYMQTHDAYFIEQSELIITKITYNSPLEANFKIDLSASNVAEAITTAIDGVVQAKQRLEKAELENKAKAQEIEQAKQKADHENKAGLLELEQKELAIERERLEILEKRLDVQKKGIEYALEIAAKTVTILHPEADEQTKGLLIQTLLPTILQLQNGKGLELALPISLSDKGKAVESEDE